MQNNETKSTSRYFIRFETDNEGIRQYKSANPESKSGTKLGQMRSEEFLVPAILFEVDKTTYEEYQRESWEAEDKAKHENRCIICGTDGKAIIRCPLRIPNLDYNGTPEQTNTIANDCENCPYGYQHLFRPIKGNVVFSALKVSDGDGNVDPFEPESTTDPLSADRYFKLLDGLISYIKNKYPQYSDYAEFVYLLGLEYEIKEVAKILNKPSKTLYGWRKKLRPIFDEYMQSVDY